MEVRRVESVKTNLVQRPQRPLNIFVSPNTARNHLVASPLAHEHQHVLELSAMTRRVVYWIEIIPFFIFEAPLYVAHNLVHRFLNQPKITLFFEGQINDWTIEIIKEFISYRN